MASVGRDGSRRVELEELEEEDDDDEDDDDDDEEEDEVAEEEEDDDEEDEEEASSEGLPAPSASRSDSWPCSCLRASTRSSQVSFA